MGRGRRTKLTPEIAKAIEEGVRAKAQTEEEMRLLDPIIEAARLGDADAAAWLRGEVFIRIVGDSPEAALVRFMPYNNQDGRISVRAMMWRQKIFERDGYRCQDCGQHGGKLQAHHILGWAQHVGERFNLDNGLTLCLVCHANRHPTHRAAILLGARFGWLDRRN